MRARDPLLFITTSLIEENTPVFHIFLQLKVQKPFSVIYFIYSFSISFNIKIVNNGISSSDRQLK